MNDFKPLIKQSGEEAESQKWDDSASVYNYKSKIINYLINKQIKLTDPEKKELDMCLKEKQCKNYKTCD